MIKNLAISFAVVVLLVAMGYVVHFYQSKPESKQFKEIVTNEYRVIIVDDSLLSSLLNNYELSDNKIADIEKDIIIYLNTRLANNINCKIAIMQNYRDFVQLFKVGYHYSDRIMLGIEFIPEKSFQYESLVTAHPTEFKADRDEKNKFFLEYDILESKVSEFFSIGPQCGYSRYSPNI